MIEQKQRNKKGFSVVEIIIAAAVLAVFISGLVSAYVSFGRQIRTSGHKQQAAVLAEEAIEAVRNIRDSAFSNLTDGTYGLATTTNQWQFSGSSDITGIFTRATTISTVSSNQKQITSTVSWQDYGNSRTVSESAYLTNWQSSVLALGGLMLYGIGTTTPQYRAYDKTANTFAAAGGTVVGADGRTFLIRTSPTKREAVAGYVSATGVLQVMCFDGSSWLNE